MTEPGLAVFEVTGGMLADVSGPPGRLEFRSVLDGGFIISAVHDFRPRLPWLVYNATQALGHLLVMHSFGRHLSRMGNRPSPAVAQGS